MIDGFDVLVMAFTAASVSAEWKLTGAKLGLLLSAGLFGMAGGSLFIAPWADKIGRKPLTLLCLVLSGAGMLASGWAQSETQLAVLRVLTGLGVGGILACSNVIASEYASQRWRGLAVSLQATGYALGATIGGSIAVWLLSQYGWRSVFLFGGCCTLAVMVLVMLRLPESLDFLLARQPADSLARLNVLLHKMGLPNLSELPVPANAEQRVGPLKLFSPELRRPTLLVWLSFFAVMFGFYFVMSWTPKLLAASGLTPAQGVTGGVLLSLGGIFGTALLGLLAARFRVNHVLAAFMIMTAVLLCFIVSNPGSLLASFSLAFLIGVFVNGCVAGLYTIASVVYDASVRATGMGWGIGVGRFGAILSPLIAGALIDAAWKPTQLYVGYGVAFLIAAVIVLLHRLQPPVAVRGGRHPANQRGALTSLDPCDQSASNRSAGSGTARLHGAEPSRVSSQQSSMQAPSNAAL
jgi:benzoate transport